MTRLGIALIIALFIFSTVVFATHIYNPRFAYTDPIFITFPATLTRPATGNLTFTVNVRYDIFWGDLYYFNKTGGWTKLVAPGTRVDREYIAGPANIPISIEVDKLYNDTMVLLMYGCDRISFGVWECSKNPAGNNAWILLNPDFVPICGNGWAEADEQCDDRNFNNSDACKSDCTLNTCGDRYLRAGVEQCDDGNTINGDGCSSSCAIESGPLCGNGQNDTGETCDDGNTLSGDGCSSSCVREPVFCVFSSIKGDVDGSGNVNSTDVNLTRNVSRQQIPPPLNLCCMDLDPNPSGNGVINIFDVADVYDVANGNSRGTCADSCGNGQSNSGEQCDDGNAVNTDSCTNTCTLAVCGDGVKHVGVEQCDDGNAVDIDACRNNCILPRCGDGIISTGIGEQCEDLNAVSGDGCSGLCRIEYRFDSCPHVIEDYIPPPGPRSGEIENQTYMNVLARGNVIYSYDGEDFTNTYTKTIDRNTTELIARNIYADAINELDRSEISGEIWNSVTGDEDILIYNLATKIMTNITVPSTSITGTDIYGNYVVYAGGITNVHDIFLYNRGARTTSQLTSDAAVQQYPKIYGDYIIYQDRSYSGGNYELTLRKISDSTFKRRINNVTGGSYAVTSEISGDYVAYNIVTDMSTRNKTLYLLKISTNQTKTIDSGLGIDFHMDHGLIVYDKGLTNVPSGNFSIFSYNISSGVTKRLINSTATPQITQIDFDEYTMIFNKLPSATSRLNSCSQFTPACGNAFTDDGEQCDDGNAIDTDECRNTCTLPQCGDNITSTGEQCDDGNNMNTDACTNSCRLAVCGDGFLRIGIEQCDDGNTNDGDGCSSTCRIAAPTLLNLRTSKNEIEKFEVVNIYSEGYSGNRVKMLCQRQTEGDTCDTLYTTRDPACAWATYSYPPNNISIGCYLKDEITQQNSRNLTVSVNITDCYQQPGGLQSWWKGDGDEFDAKGRADGYIAPDTCEAGVRIDNPDYPQLCHRNSDGIEFRQAGPAGIEFTAGKVGKAFSFDGDDFVVVPKMPNVTQAVTIGAWINFAPPYLNGDAPRTLIIAEKKHVYYFAAYDNGVLHFGINQDVGASEGCKTSPNAFQEGVWTYVAVTFDGAAGSNQAKIYVNETLVRQCTISGQMSTYYNDDARFGGGGKLDEVTIFNRSLSFVEIRDIGIKQRICRHSGDPRLERIILNSTSVNRGASLAIMSEGGATGSYNLTCKIPSNGLSVLPGQGKICEGANVNASARCTATIPNYLLEGNYDVECFLTEQSTGLRSGTVSQPLQITGSCQLKESLNLTAPYNYTFTKKGYVRLGRSQSGWQLYLRKSGASNETSMAVCGIKDVVTPCGTDRGGGNIVLCNRDNMRVANELCTNENYVLDEYVDLLAGDRIRFEKTSGTQRLEMNIYEC